MSLMPLGLLSQGGGAGAGPNALTLISTTILGSATSEVNFTSIPSTYKHLQLRIVGRVDSAGDSSMTLRFNSDTSGASTYSWRAIRGTGSSVTATYSYTNNRTTIAYLPGTSSTANSFGTSIIDILDYANTSKNKTIRTLNGAPNLTGTYTATNQAVVFWGGGWFDTSAISAIKVSDYAANLIAGSRLSLYGVS